MSRTAVTLVMPYYENPGMLRRHYDALKALPADLRDFVSLVIVDDGSPKSPAWAEDLNGMSLQVYRIDVDIRWNQDAARNIGAHHSQTEWMLLTDIDHMVQERTWKTLTSRSWEGAFAYTFRRVSEPDLMEYKPHPNSWFLTRKIYRMMGGYDESFAGFYGTDADFRDRLKAVAPFKTIKEYLVRVPRSVTPDASTVDYLRKQPEDGEGIKSIKAQRAKAGAAWVIKNRSFPYHRVYP